MYRDCLDPRRIGSKQAKDPRIRCESNPVCGPKTLAVGGAGHKVRTKLGQLQFVVLLSQWELSHWETGLESSRRKQE